jgi:hypothetical protein
LKYDDDKDNEDGTEFLENPARHIEIQKAGGKIDERYNSQSKQNLDGTCPAKPGVHLVQNNGHDQYICNILYAN